VTKDMLDAPDKRLFVLIGGLEAVSQLLGFVGASKLPGAARDHPRAGAWCSAASSLLLRAARAASAGCVGDGGCWGC
jgi:hypothetical protein